jgi:microcompartment protein CcmL/EutN
VGHPGPALGLIELCSIARGIVACDAMVKKAAVRLIQARSTHPGKYSILVGGGVEEVDEALGAGETVAAESLIDRLFLPNPHPQLVEVLVGPRQPKLASIGILETFSIAATIRGADAALKAAQVDAIHIRLARDLGGKGFFVLTGLLHDVEEAMSAGTAAVGPGLLAGREVVANPHPDVAQALE